ncbi:hypothetical protein F7725_005087 [Dissostichus mawsoni]|uniref:Uncharacterized protein n=1 Tax=Dissostichus mawsoni TaxID=36200 RepID=A0A7J5YQ87_DISMA|nr:hypothetical protein F7725_005087 [Dissostichus mawsoni]
MSFKLLSRVSAESIPITACMLDPWYKNLKFLPEDIRDDAQARLTRVWEHRKEEQPGATGGVRRWRHSCPLAHLHEEGS